MHIFNFLKKKNEIFIYLVNVFACRLLDKGETERGISQMRQLLESQGEELEESVRRGDLFAVVAQHYVDIGDENSARAAIEEVKQIVPGINLSYYFNIRLLESLGYKLSVQSENPEEKDDAIEELINEQA